MFAVAAQAQTKGRGTRGRDWLSAQNNLMLTVAIRRNSLPIPLMLLPLRYDSDSGSTESTSDIEYVFEFAQRTVSCGNVLNCTV